MKNVTYRGYLLDLDGTMYRGNEPIESAVQFVQRLAFEKIPYVFMTNNSAQTRKQVVQKLTRFGVPVKVDQVMTSGMATAQYISEKSSSASVFMIGEIGLKEALQRRGLTLVADERADYVVAGIDRSMTYEKYAKACLAIQGGATFIATNGDRAIPTERGLVPGNGALTAIISTATGIRPTVIGKPERVIVEQALHLLNVPKDEVVVVGDNYATDICAGINAGIDTLLVCTGVTQKKDLQKVATGPTHVVSSLAEWNG